MMKRKFLAIASAAVLSATMPSTANAAVTVNLDQVGTSVIATASGTLSLSGLVYFSNSYTLTSAVNGSGGYVGSGTAGSSLDSYTGFAGPASFGTGGLMYATDNAGTAFAVNGTNFGTPVVFVQSGYVSGSAIASTLTFANSTFASLGLDQGVYAYASSNDTVTVRIGSVAAVPEPATWAMMVGGFGMLGSALRRRRPAMAQA